LLPKVKKEVLDQIVETTLLRDVGPKEFLDGCCDIINRDNPAIGDFIMRWIDTVTTTDKRISRMEKDDVVAVETHLMLITFIVYKSLYTQDECDNMEIDDVEINPDAVKELEEVEVTKAESLLQEMVDLNQEMGLYDEPAAQDCNQETVWLLMGVYDKSYVSDEIEWKPVAYFDNEQDAHIYRSKSSGSIRGRYLPNSLLYGYDWSYITKVKNKVKNVPLNPVAK
jgi:hypothetical protein